jgi:hypothetical protein
MTGTIMTKAWFALTAVLALAACTASEVASDATPPELTLSALNRAGNPTFSSREGADTPADACAHFAIAPAHFALSVSDAGGVGRVTVRAAFGRIDPASVIVAPGAPESSLSVASTSSGNEIDVGLSPPGPGLVRTGVLLTFDVVAPSGPPVGVIASAADTHGNLGGLYQVDVRQPGDSVRCRGDRN